MPREWVTPQLIELDAAARRRCVLDEWLAMFGLQTEPPPAQAGNVGSSPILIAKSDLVAVVLDIVHARLDELERRRLWDEWHEAAAKRVPSRADFDKMRAMLAKPSRADSREEVVRRILGQHPYLTNKQLHEDYERETGTTARFDWIRKTAAKIRKEG
jgi:hypothetical protein